MGHKNWKDMTVKLDSSTGVLTEITSSVNQNSLRHAMNLIEEEWFGQKRNTYQSGKAGATASLNGMVNSTTEGILGPLVGNHTTVTKTIQIYNGIKYYNGEVWPTGIEFSGRVGELQVWSGDFTFSSAVNRTSTAL